MVLRKRGWERKMEKKKAGEEERGRRERPRVSETEREIF